MSPGEIAWRVRDAGRDAIDRWRFAAGLIPGQHGSPTSVPFASSSCRVTDIPVGAWEGTIAPPLESWRRRLLAEADELMAHRLSFFNLKSRDAGHPIDWNRDLETGRSTPRGYAPAIDYRDAATSGDAKVVWEPSRHQHLVVLGRAYRATGDVKYAREVTAQIVSWLDQSPFGYGMNWRSPLELAVRVINWVWALDLIRESGAVSASDEQRIRHAIHLHAWDIARKFSGGSSANNHLIGEAAGVFVATAYLPDWPGHREWHERSRQILTRELFAQTHADGGSREQAPGYQVFVLQFFMVAGVLARKLGADFPADYWKRIELMLDFLAGLTEGGSLPMFGDADSGYVLDLGARGSNPATVLSAGAVLFDRSDFVPVRQGIHEWAYWLLGPSSLDRVAAPPAPLASRAFPKTGYYLLQCGMAGTDETISLVVDCAELGFGPLAAHGHADALSFILRIGGEDVLTDPGTYDYFTFPEWRRYLRGTRAHNTVTVDGQDQSVISGPFMWGARANVTNVEWRPTPSGGTVTGEHDGYLRLRNPVVHRRSINLDGDARTVVIRDEIVTMGEHDIEVVFQFSEHCRVSPRGSAFRVEIGQRAITFEPDPQLSSGLVPHSDSVDGGWVSREYHERSPAPKLVGRARTSGSGDFTTTLRY